jgi:hypothetical protein
MVKRGIKAKPTRVPRPRCDRTASTSDFHVLFALIDIITTNETIYMRHNEIKCAYQLSDGHQ